MADRVLRVILTGDAAGLTASMAEADAATDAAADAMGGSVGGLGKDMDEAGEKSEGLFSKLGNAMSNMGLPFGNAVKDMGEKLDQTSTKGEHFSQAMQDAGGAIVAGVAVAAIGIGVESLHMADKFDTAQAMMDTAITNAGGSVTALTPQLNKAYASAADLGFNMTDVAGAMQVLTTATNSPKKALGDLGLAEDLARMKGVSLTTASGALAKVYGGSTRALTQMGLNLDIGSGKLTGIRTATESVSKAQLALKLAEEGVADGSIKAAVAGTTLQAAHMNLADAEQKLHLDQTAITTILSTLTQRTKGAATAFGQTLPGQIDIGKAHLEDLGIRFGLLEEKGIKVVERGLVSVVTWFEKNSWAAKILAGVIGTALASAVATFAVAKVAQFVGGAQKMAASFGQMVSKIVGGSAVAETSEEDVAATSETTGEATSTAFGPIGIAIGLLVVAFMLLHSHWKAIWKDIRDVAKDAWHFLDDDVFHPITNFFSGIFHDTILTAEHLWDTVWGAVKTVIGDAWSFIKSHIDLIAGILMGPFGFAIAYAATHWKQVWGDIKGAGLAAWHFIDNQVLHPLTSFFYGAWTATVNGAKAVWHAFWSGVQTVVQGVWSVIGPIIHEISEGIGEIGKLVGDIGGAGGKVLKFLHLASGGLVTQPTMAIIGEQGPELVLNQKQTSFVMAGGSVGANPMRFSGGAAAAAAAAGGSSTPVYLDVRMLINGREIANALSPDIRAALLRGGRSTITIGLT